MTNVERRRMALEAEIHAVETLRNEGTMTPDEADQQIAAFMAEIDGLSSSEAAAADAENQANAVKAAAEVAAKAANIRRVPAPQQQSGHPNDGAVEILTAAEIVKRLADADAGQRRFALVALDTVKMVRGQQGTGDAVSGYCRVLVNSKAIGALTIYAPKADEMAATVLREPKAVKLYRDIAASKRLEMGRLYPLKGLEGEALLAQLAKRAPLESDAEAADQQAQAALDGYLASVKAAKGTWQGKTALDVIHWRETAGGTAGANAGHPVPVSPAAATPTVPASE